MPDLGQMQIYTITREEIERFKLQNDNHSLPDNLDMLVAAVAYDRADNRAINAATGIRWIDAEMCDADDNIIDMADVPKRTIYRLVSQQQMRKDLDKRREERMGAL